MRWPISRVLSRTIIHLGQMSPSASSNLPGNHAGRMSCRSIRSSIWSCSRWGLPCHYCYQQRGALLPHPFTLTLRLRVRRFAFCCTSRGLTSPRCYLAPYPVEPGLSSPLQVRLSGHLSGYFRVMVLFLLKFQRDVISFIFLDAKNRRRKRCRLFERHFFCQQDL